MQIRTRAVLSLVGLVVSCVVLFEYAKAEDELPFVFQSSGSSKTSGLSISYTAGIGTREARPFGQEGIEQKLSLRYAPTEWLALEGFGAVAARSGEVSNPSAGLEAAIKLLAQRSFGVNLAIGAGVVYDYWQTVVPRARATLWRSLGPVELTLSAIAELPLSEIRDEVDLILSVGAAYAFSDYVKLGAEAAGEDLEGFWEEEEAEGGAKLVVGPTLWLAPTYKFTVRLNAAAVIPATENQPTYGSAPAQGYGFLGRLSLTYSF